MRTVAGLRVRGATSSTPGRDEAAERELREHRVQRVAQPHPVQRVLDVLAAQDLVDEVARRGGDLVEGGVVRETVDVVERAHVGVLPGGGGARGVADRRPRSNPRRVRSAHVSSSRCWSTLNCSRAGGTQRVRRELGLGEHVRVERHQRSDVGPVTRRARPCAGRPRTAAVTTPDGRRRADGEPRAREMPRAAARTAGTMVRGSAPALGTTTDIAATTRSSSPRIGAATESESRSTIPSQTATPSRRTRGQGAAQRVRVGDRARGQGAAAARRGPPPAPRRGRTPAAPGRRRWRAGACARRRG